LREKTSPVSGGFSECPQIKDDFERLCCELEELKRVGEIVVGTVKDTFNPFPSRSWTVMKLLFLKMYVRDVYTPIIGKRYKKMYFIDLFAGTGLNSYENAEFFIPGSTLVAWFFATYPFDRIYAVGYDMPKDRPPYIWLEKRLKPFIPPKRLRVLRGDANKKVDEIVGELKDEAKREDGGVHFLAFIDPNCTEVYWSTIEKLVALENLAFTEISSYYFKQSL